MDSTEKECYNKMKQIKHDMTPLQAVSYLNITKSMMTANMLKDGQTSEELLSTIVALDIAVDIILNGINTSLKEKE